MPRITASRKQLKPDPLYGSLLAGKFINCLMHDGKKAVAQSVLYDALEIVRERVRRRRADQRLHPGHREREAVDRSSLEARWWCRLSGADASRPHASAVLSFRWILAAVRDKKGRPTAQKLADELVAAYNREGAAMTKRENVHRMADANKAFAHFGW